LDHEPRERAESDHMSPRPAVSCTCCGFSWNSVALADGLRALGECPKCSGALDFAVDPAAREVRFAPLARSPHTAPHLVLGIPRR
jgi:hypothetical protein